MDAGGGLVVESGTIVEIIPAGQRPILSCSRVFDASRHVVLPGLINTHHHFYQTLTRAFSKALNKKLFPWLKSLYPVWARLDEQAIAVSSQLAAAELLLSGCTTAADHHYIFPSRVPHALDVQVEAIKNTGIRANLTRGSMSLGEDQGGLPPRNTVQDEQTILRDSERVIRQYHDSRHGSAMQIALAPCSPFSVSEELMRESARLARQHQVRLHTHLAETEDETAYCLSMFGVRPVDYLERVDWLAEDVWLAHGIHFNDEEIRRLGGAGVGISHCASSNMVLASGFCRTLELERAGCAVGLGVDGSASNDCSNLVQEARQAFLLQRLHYGASEVSHLDALRWATTGSAACLGRKDVGWIDTGMCADLALFKLDELRFSGSDDPLAALLLCGAH
ncbi:MAG: 8-oxoguanine deaminase, partial [Gammaproteobacteria bacterium]|nr:8-oxoguanine deaminase [Gammaproteobacteria bacterium]